MFLVIAYRYGDKEGYHFPIGIFPTKEIAIREAKDHHLYRGGKYDHMMYEMELTEEYDDDKYMKEDAGVWITGNQGLEIDETPSETICPKCGIDSKGSLLFTCGNRVCPIDPKGD